MLNRPWRGPLVLGVLASLSCGAITSVATADHYHVNCVNHGLVHGASTNDSAFHSRVEGSTYDCAWFPSRCDPGQWSNVFMYGNAGRGATCDTFAGNVGPECVGLSRTAKGDIGIYVFAYHAHWAHNRCF